VTPEAILAAGNEVLSPVLNDAGFRLSGITTGSGSGGAFAVGCWVRPPQWIELHVRGVLGIVRYGWGDESFDHAHLAGALVVSTAYPAFSGDPVDGFRHLAQDLRGPLAPLLASGGADALHLARAWQPPGRRLP